MLGGGAEHTQGGVALELVDPTAVPGDDSDYDREEAVQGTHDDRRILRGGDPRRANQVDEQDCGFACLPAEPDPTGECLAGYVLTDVTAEQITETLSLAEPCDHAVKAGLQEAYLVTVIDGHYDVGPARFHVGERGTDRLQRVRQRAGSDRR